MSAIDNNDFHRFSRLWDSYLLSSVSVTVMKVASAQRHFYCSLLGKNQVEIMLSADHATNCDWFVSTLRGKQLYMPRKQTIWSSLGYQI